MIFSIVYLALSKNQLLLGTLFCAGLIALYLKSNTDLPLKLAQERMLSSFSYASVDLEKVSTDRNGWSERLARVNPDILTFSNVDEEWAQVLYDSLTNKYSNYRIYDRMDNYGIAIFSRYPLEDEITLESGMIPMPVFKVTLPFSRKKLRIILSHIVDAKSKYFTSYFETQSSAIRNFVLTAPKIPLLIGGKFEVVTWNQNLSDLKHHLKLRDSRRNYFIAQVSNFGWPYVVINKSNIWYNELLECAKVDNISLNRNPIGLSSSYQIRQ